MKDPETTRLVAHVLLDGVAVHNDPNLSEDDSDEMRNIAIDRLAEVEAVRVTQNDETGRLQVDIVRLATAAMLVVKVALESCAEATGQDRDVLIAGYRAEIDRVLENEQPDGD
jgi:hypothetical protein